VSKFLRIPFSEWAPDIGEFDHPSVYFANNVWPAPQGYVTPVDPGTEISAGVNGNAEQSLGGLSVVANSGLKYLFWGGQQDIYRVSATSTTEIVSSSTAVYTTATVDGGGRWEFVQWADTIIGTNWDDEMQDMALTSSSFSKLNDGEDTINARHIAVARNFVILGYTFDDTDGTSPSRVRWSALNDPTDWEVSATTQADFQDLKSYGGAVQRLFGGEYAVVFQERSVSRMTYVGTPTIWQFDEVVPQRGLLTPGAAAQVENKIFYLSNDGFKVLINGSDSQRIGVNRVDNFALSELDRDYINRIQCDIDPCASRVYWFIPEGAENGTVFAYDYTLDKWGVSDQRTDAVVPIAVENDHYGTIMGELTYDDASGANVLIYDDFGDTDLVRSIVKTGMLQLTPNRDSMIKNVTLGFAHSNSLSETRLRANIQSFRSPYDQSPRTLNVEQSQTSSPVLRLSARMNGRYHTIQAVWHTEREDMSHIGDEIKYIEVEYVPTHWR